MSEEDIIRNDGYEFITSNTAVMKYTNNELCAKTQ